MQQEIIAIKDRMIDAIISKDVDASIQVFARESVMYLLNPPLRFKTSENAPGAPGIKEWFDTFEGPIQLSYQELEVTASDQVAFCHSLDHLKGMRTDGTYTNMWYRETLGFQKIDGQWKVAHQHQSFPMYMDGSGKAASDLKPW
ncbi:Ketosteroid isomerase homolog [Dyadobacter soli]|uniref:Ketosteroid isomerase homolog n=1 Tax=Dyadobacter soli TaxID=659014 RepID=A0A1G7MNN0_9BACT|nr:nuclear transport factor 2 family protein [Dyadobacter soli]SDF63343.1 Ketosteroid isomerase homolog [Dyadobacter soli]